MRKLRIGIIGAGIMGRGNAKALSGEPDVQITGVTSRRRESAEDLVADLTQDQAPIIFDDAFELLQSSDVDAVVITTPDDLHAEMVVAAADAGKHVLCEKPLTTSVAEADRAVEAVRRNGVVAMCLFNHRWVPAYAQAKELVTDLGEAAVGYARKDDTIFVPTEMLSWADRTTCAWFLSSHDIDLMNWLVDDTVASVFATARFGKLRGMGIDTPDAVQIQAEYSRGAVATFESAWIYPNTFPTTVDSYVTLACDDGVVQIDRQKENVVLARDNSYTYPRNMLQRVTHGIPAGAYRDAIRHFVNCSLSGAEPLISIESSRDVTAVLEAAHESIRTRHPVAVTGRPGSGSVS